MSAGTLNKGEELSPLGTSGRWYEILTGRSVSRLAADWEDRLGTGLVT